MVTNPAASGENWVVGENLFDFLSLGYYRGFFALEQLSYARALTLRVFTDPKWEPTESKHRSVGYEMDAEKQPILALLITTFALRPWRDAARFEELQASYRPLLEPAREEP